MRARSGVWVGLTAIAAVAGLAASARAQEKSFATAVRKPPQAVFEPATARRGEVIKLRVVTELANGWHTYPTAQPDPKSADQVVEFDYPTDDKSLVFLGRARNVGEAHKRATPVGDQLEYFGTVVWEQDVVVSPSAEPGEKSPKLRLKMPVCDEDGCLPPKKISLAPALTITTDPPVPIDPKHKAAYDLALGVAPAEAPPPPSSGNRAGLEQVLVQLEGNAQTAVTASTDLWSFLATAVFWGAVALVTPCVFPMIPITVSYFLKQTEKTHHNPLTTAIIYCATIIIVLGVAAMTLLTTFRQLSVNPYMNIFLGLLFLVLSLSLFGMFEITLPSFLSRFTSEREGRGGVVGTVFMALTFTIVSFTCVAPFLGGFGGMADSKKFSTFQLLLGALAFSTTFAAPFFLLALFPSLLKKVPKSGSWLNSVKVVMGFLEVAAGLVFLRTAELRLLPMSAYFTYDVVLGAMIVLSLACGLYLLGIFRLHHDTPVESITAPRLLLSLMALGLAVYLVPALFRAADGQRQRPAGVVYAWIDSFLLPEPSKKGDGLMWTGDLKKAIDDARMAARSAGDRQLIFVDFTGVTCKNCRINEHDVFTRDEIKDLFKRYRLVQLYTDTVPAEYYPGRASKDQRERDAEANLWFQKEVFKTEQLPLYVILDPRQDGKIEVVGVYPEAKINDVPGFTEFLRRPLEKSSIQAMK